MVTHVTDPRHHGKMQHSFTDVTTVAVCGICMAFDTFEQIEIWAKEKIGGRCAQCRAGCSWPGMGW
ncbi:transposase family protein [Halomonas sp.]|uniref:transposase family protein n=1 Tax=Halomonas sp. TaxID=1486246 RepID=UPI0038600E4B